MENTLSIERQKIKINHISAVCSSPIPLAVRTARWAARPWEGRLVHREMWSCWSLPAISAHQTAPCNGNHGPSLQLETAPFAFHLWRSLFLAIQHVNNTKNIFKKRKEKKKSIKCQAGCKIFLPLFLDGGKGWKLSNALPEPLKAQHL